ncbi:adaptor protein [compost metagenome]
MYFYEHDCISLGLGHDFMDIIQDRASVEKLYQHAIQYLQSVYQLSMFNYDFTVSVGLYYRQSIEVAYRLNGTSLFDDRVINKLMNPLHLREVIYKFSTFDYMITALDKIVDDLSPWLKEMMLYYYNGFYYAKVKAPVDMLSDASIYLAVLSEYGDRLKGPYAVLDEYGKKLLSPDMTVVKVIDLYSSRLEGV